MDSLSSTSHEALACVSRELRPGEQLFWSDCPHLSHRAAAAAWRMQHLQLALRFWVNLLLVGASLLMAGLVALIGLLIGWWPSLLDIAVWAGLTLAVTVTAQRAYPAYRASRQQQRAFPSTWYALTSERAIILSCAPSYGITSFSPAERLHLVRVESRDGYGDLVFRMPAALQYRFAGIARVRDIERLVLGLYPTRTAHSPTPPAPPAPSPSSNAPTGLRETSDRSSVSHPETGAEASSPSPDQPPSSVSRQSAQEAG